MSKKQAFILLSLLLVVYTIVAGLGFRHDDTTPNADAAETPNWMDGLGSLTPGLTKAGLSGDTDHLFEDAQGRLCLDFTDVEGSLTLKANPDNWLESGRLSIECPANATLKLKVDPWPDGEDQPEFPRQSEDTTDEQIYSGNFTLNDGDSITFTLDTEGDTKADFTVPITK